MDGQSSHRRAPRSVQEIVNEAEKFDFNTNIAFKHWIRAAETLYQEGKFALRDGDYEKAYLMLYRHSSLVIDKLRTHPEYALNRKYLNPLYNRQEAVFKDLERIKPYVKRDYDEWVRIVQIQNEKEEHRRAQSRSSSSSVQYAADPGVASRGFGIRMLSAADHQDLAVDLAREEMGKRAKRRGGMWESPKAASPTVGDDDDYRSHMEAARRQLDYRDRQTEKEKELERQWQRDREREIQRDSGRQRSMTPVKAERVYDYPPVLRPGYSPEPTRNIMAPEPRRPPPPPHPPKELAPRPLQAPLIPLKEPLANSGYAPAPPSPTVPVRPPKELLSREVSPMPATVGASVGPPSLSAPEKKERVSFRPSAHLENGAPLRPVFLPSTLRAAFLELAAENTRRGIEMCGILCGSPVNNALFVTCLLIPDQKCTPDTCETENEDTTLAYCLEQDLIVIGWIHTHPTQSCFMSSRDLHTQAGYQVMMPESIAIVCAPRSTPSYGIFRLTRPPGLDHILSCTRKETFHPHDIDNLYTETEQPSGHVYESSKLGLQVHDLRSARF